MAYEQFANADYTTLTASYTAGAGSITVAHSNGDNGGFPTSPNFRIRILDPVTRVTKARLKVTAIPGGGVTLTTTSDGLDANCATNDVVENVLSKNGLLQMMADGCQEDTYANLATPLGANGPFPGAVLRQTDGPYDWRWNGSIWVPRVAGFGTVGVPPSSGWTADNGASSALTWDSTYGSLHTVATRSGATSVRMLYRTAPSAPYTITFWIKADICGFIPSGTTGANAGAGVGFRDGAGKIESWWCWYNTNWNIAVSKWASSTSLTGHESGLLYTSVMADTWASAMRGQGIYLQLIDDNTNLKFRYSVDGRNWGAYAGSISRTANFASGPTQYGLVSYVNGNQIEMQCLSIVES